MQSIISSEIFIITLVAGVYLAALWLYRKTRLALLHPLLVSIPALVAVMSVIGIPYESFRQGSRMINFLLGPSVVALGYVLWEQRVAGSNPVTPTENETVTKVAVFLLS